MGKRHASRQRGATLITTALMATGLVVFAGLVADTGGMLYQRTRMQVAADASALAGARGLATSSSHAVAQAVEVAQQNGFVLDPSGVGIVSGSRMQVTLGLQTPSLVGRVLTAMQGPTSQTLSVGARAIADLHVQPAMAGPRPFGVPHCAMVPGGEYTLKDGPHGSYRGHFQALSLDGTGANLYRDAILHGAKAQLAVGHDVLLQPGNMAGPTAQAVGELIAGDFTSFQAAQQGIPTPRVIVVPLIGDDYFLTDGRKNLSVVGFARFYVTYTTSLGEVYGRFIDKVDSPQTASGAPKFTVRLVDVTEPLPPAYHPAS